MDKCVILDLDNTLICMHKPRPYLKEFIAFLFDNFKHVAIWTAAEKSWLHTVHNTILKPLIPNGKKFAFMWSRIDCSTHFAYCPVKRNVERHTFKDLHNVFGAYVELNPKNTLIIDDNLITCNKNVNNSLHIKPFNDEEAETIFYRPERKQIMMPSLVFNEDDELLKMITFIRDKILHVEDVRMVPKIYWYEHPLQKPY